MSETFANEFSSVYFTGPLGSPALHQEFCGNLESTVITYKSVCKRLSTIAVEDDMKPNVFHSKFLFPS